ncbi:TetR/AcrR family transcriptional regulator [Cellulomonas fimi]|uniref:Regulatory protein TetR n=1 Tax=Cellulomonas fimi (strain ATCC 484 / DSM 20113 / JCM 1341 / CCUG 24087 / LMG 16345 / NBRC 15513 / NCIMB 8980 / NCTC 7547 / NRS-133) TaxID=590998 RepID=F4H605_CELFA|nr:TetR/AcrR family transcriptional regulator [Cellulomonas fimi]AEE46735.1 regulatory protein TetR [Cellulomonas fimi ATCC 484]NNH07620.1 TetR/AcrR family transcriptional regulator [Cellulomonas fimi]VEH34027.1 Toluene efflux pump ttgABC operon repressor [Cellulomonas fimi]
MDAPRTRAESQARTREDLLDAAQEVFGRRGFHGASVADVARAAGRTKGAVYANFAGKEELFLAVLDRHIARAGGQPSRPAEGAPAGGDERRGRGTEAQFDRSWGLLAFEAVLYAVREAPDLLAEFATRYRQVDALTARRLRASGDVPPERVDDLAVARSALGEGLMLRHLVDPETVSHAVIERVFDAVFPTPADGG